MLTTISTVARVKAIRSELSWMSTCNVRPARARSDAVVELASQPSALLLPGQDELLARDADRLEQTCAASSGSGSMLGSGTSRPRTARPRFRAGLRYRPTTSVSLATSSGSVENLNVSARYGFTPNSCQAFATVEWSTPTRAVRSRDDQCVTPNLAGGGFNVSATIARRSTRAGRLGRSRSLSPPRPGSTYRDRHRFTVGRASPAECLPVRVSCSAARPSIFYR